MEEFVNDNEECPVVDLETDAYFMPPEVVKPEDNDAQVLILRSFFLRMKQIIDALNEKSLSDDEWITISGNDPTAEFKFTATRYADGHWEAKILDAYVLPGIELMPWLTDCMSIGIAPLALPVDDD